MSPKLPVVSGRQVVKALQRIGYRVVRQRGSHIRLRDETNPNHFPITVPDHETVVTGSIMVMAPQEAEHLVRYLAPLPRFAGRGGLLWPGCKNGAASIDFRANLHYTVSAQ
jgi:predicted RNA binding protein YcfA (HicA-like mRNA interferase family)